MTTIVAVPYRAGNEHRERSWEYVRKWWESHGFTVHTGDTPGPFNRAAARNAAAAGEWDVAIFGDADTFMRSVHDLGPALQLARQGLVVLPHDHYIGLTPGGSNRVISGRPWRHGVKVEKDDVPLGIVVVGRAAWDQLGGFDERFTGWGGEDVAFRLAAETFGLLHRTTGTLVHLWHPIDPTKSQYIASRGGALRQEYREASGKPAAMRKLLEGR